MHLVLIFGVPGSGKKSVGEALEKLSGYPLLHNHLVLDLVRKFLPAFTPPSIQLARTIRRDLIAAAAIAQIPGMIITFAGGSPGARETIREWITRVEQAGGRATFVELSCAYSDLLRRISDPSRIGTTKIQSSHELDGFLKKDYFKGLEGYDPIRIDTTSTPPEEAAQEIMKYLS